MKVVPKDTSPIEEETTSPWRTVLILAAVGLLGIQLGFSTVVIILALIVMIFMHELGHYLTAKAAGMKVTEFFIGFGPRIWSFQRGETEYGLKVIPAGAYVRIIGMSNLEEIDRTDEDRTYRSKPYWRKMSVAVAGSTMHFLMAFALIVTILAGFGIANEHASSWSIGTITKPSAAYDAGLRPGDRIVSVDGRSFATFKELSKYLQAHPGEEVDLRVMSAGEERELSARLAETNPNGKHVGFLGVGARFPTERLGPVTAVRRGVGEMWTVTRMSVAAI